MKFTSLILLGSMMVATPAIVGCDDVKSKEETVEHKSDGTVVHNKEETKQKSDGTIVHEEKKSVDRPNP